MREALQATAAAALKRVVALLGLLENHLSGSRFLDQLGGCCSRCHWRWESRAALPCGA